MDPVSLVATGAGAVKAAIVVGSVAIKLGVERDALVPLAAKTGFSHPIDIIKVADKAHDWAVKCRDHEFEVKRSSSQADETSDTEADDKVVQPARRHEASVGSGKHKHAPQATLQLVPTLEFAKMREPRTVVITAIMMYLVDTVAARKNTVDSVSTYYTAQSNMSTSSGFYFDSNAHRR
ncbi:hypothetical protein EWM64_g1846 [Hericium alpestre]|uniref:Uncharacterized protein n=1 Tax=Hericium alpestre TaxID=135208 RepID=A0A4Z0A583_9AGAM|nr:hypothetical protein EWM64_g1846 [Hericium alpestre]